MTKEISKHFGTSRSVSFRALKVLLLVFVLYFIFMMYNYHASVMDRYFKELVKEYINDKQEDTPRTRCLKVVTDCVMQAPKTKLPYDKWTAQNWGRCADASHPSHQYYVNNECDETLGWYNNKNLLAEGDELPDGVLDASLNERQLSEMVRTYKHPMQEISEIH